MIVNALLFHVSTLFFFMLNVNLKLLPFLYGNKPQLFFLLG